MASSTQVRTWWKAWKCAPARYARVEFPGDGRVWRLSVADDSAPIWKAVAQIMASEPYLFLETAGGTYNCRPPSLHAYALAIDINPAQNPMRYPVKHNYPESFITRMEGIRANGKQAIQWGGRWPASNPPDTMHWQINVAPSDVKNVTWDTGGGATLPPATLPPVGGDDVWTKPEDGPEAVDNIDDARRVNAYQGWSFWTEADFNYDANNAAELDERMKVITSRIVAELMKPK